MNQIESIFNKINSSPAEPFVSKIVSVLLHHLLDNPAGRCHIQSALLSRTLMELYDVAKSQKCDCTWVVGYFEMYDTFQNYCTHTNPNVKSNICWHSWVELDGKIIDIAIISQGSHYGFGVVFLDDILVHQGLSINQNKEIVDATGTIVAKYHYSYPKSINPNYNEDVPFFLKLNYPPYDFIDSLMKVSMGENWEKYYSMNAVRRTTRVHIRDVDWIEDYDSEGYHRAYISRYTLTCPKTNHIYDTLNEAIQFINKTYEQSRITETVVFLPKSIPTNVIILSNVTVVHDISDYIKKYTPNESSDHIAYIVYGNFNLNDSSLFALEELYTTRIIVAIHDEKYNLSVWQNHRGVKSIERIKSNNNTNE